MTYAYFHTVRDVPHLYYTQKQEKINRKWGNNFAKTWDFRKDCGTPCPNWTRGVYC